MLSVKDGGPAFPVVVNESGAEVHFGISIRDYFAARALHGLLTHSRESTLTDREWALRAYSLADEMLIVREQSGSSKIASNVLA